MAVREFNGTSDDLVQNLGAATSQTFGTAAMLLKFSTVTSFRSLLQFNDSTYTFVSAPLDFTNFGTFSTFYSTGSDTGFSASTGIWYLVVIRKATGTATPRYSIYNYNTSSWTHGNSAGGAEANGTATGAGGRSGFAFQGGSDFFGGRVAMRAAWSNSLPWTADASGDSALVAAGLHTSAANWVSNNPSVCWKYDQASTATAVPDISSGGTGTQISITGTTVINGDDPPGFDFSLGAAAAPPPVQLQHWPALKGGRWPRRQKATGDLPVVAATNAPADVATATGVAYFDSSGGSISLNLVADTPITATGTAFDATVSTAPHTNATAGLAAATGAANNTTSKVSPGPTVATATGVANNATVSTAAATNAAAGIAAATGTAYNTTSSVSPGPAVATATGMAFNASVSAGGSASANAGTATGTGTANAPTQIVAPGASVASATGTAQQPTVTIAASPSVATATGAGYSTTSKVSSVLFVAAATGAAFNATVQTGSFTNAAAGLATAIGTANGATGKVSPTPGVATATGTAFNASAGSSVSVNAGVATAIGTAYGATITRGVSALAGLAAATGTAHGAGSKVLVTAGAAVAVGTANNAVSPPSVTPRPNTGRTIRPNTGTTPRP